MILNKNQEEILVEISKNRGNTNITSLGKRISNTYMSTYYNIQTLRLYGYVDLRKKKNKITIILTPKGEIFVKVILEKNKKITKK